jgi:hypothetical protein
MVDYKIIKIIEMQDSDWNKALKKFFFHIWKVFEILSPYCPSIPYVTKNMLKER